jgi:hypothetical protein
MISAYHHVAIAGIRYRLAEDAEGQHYTLTRQPLRLQTGAVVQGESGKFQLRPDLLEWTMTDWSGGEGQVLWDEKQANRYHISHNIDPLVQPGRFRLADGYQATLDNAGATFAEVGVLTKGRDALWVVTTEDDEIYSWNTTTKRWSAGTTNAEAGFGDFFEDLGHTGDTLALYLKENAVASIWKYNGTTFVEWNTDNADTGPNALVQLGDYIYYRKALASGSQGILEIPKSGTAPVASTLILDLSDLGLGGLGLPLLAAADNRVFAAAVGAEETVIYEIIPSTASATGFGRELLRQKGFQADCIWYHMGLLFMAGRQQAAGDREQQLILYLQGESVGIVAKLRPDIAATSPIVSNDAATFDLTYFLAKYGPGDFTHEWTLFAVDLVTGNVAPLTVFNFGEATEPSSLVAWRGEVFTSKKAGAGKDRVYRTVNGTFVDTSAVTAYLESPIHDFALTDEKILVGFEIQLEPLPSACSIQLQYQIDQDGTWTSLAALTTDNATGQTLTVSTADSPVIFRNLQWRLLMENGGTTSQTPEILSVTARATVAKGLRVWDLLLDLADDNSETGVAVWTGTHKYNTLLALTESNTVVELVDGYDTRITGTDNLYNVIVDEVQVRLDRPGEGVAQVRLREVIV